MNPTASQVCTYEYMRHKDNMGRRENQHAGNFATLAVVHQHDFPRASYRNLFFPALFLLSVKKGAARSSRNSTCVAGPRPRQTHNRHRHTQ